MYRKLFFAVAVVALVTAVAPKASADVFQLNNDFCTTLCSGIGVNESDNVFKVPVAGVGIPQAVFEILNGNNVDFEAAVATTRFDTNCAGVLGGGNGAGAGRASPTSGRGGSSRGAQPPPTP